MFLHFVGDWSFLVGQKFCGLVRASELEVVPIQRLRDTADHPTIEQRQLVKVLLDAADAGGEAHVLHFSVSVFAAHGAAFGCKFPVPAKHARRGGSMVWMGNLRLARGCYGVGLASVGIGVLLLVMTETSHAETRRAACFRGGIKPRAGGVQAGRPSFEAQGDF